MTLAIGIAGAALILVFFVLNEYHVLSNESLWYDGGNLLGSLLLLIYAYQLGSLPFLILNAIWMLVSLRDAYLDLRR